MSRGGSDFGRELLACAVDGTAAEEHPLRHVADLAPRQASAGPWPRWVGKDVVRAFVERGVSEPWSHQVAAAELAHSGRHVVLSTGTASGKSLAYQLPILCAMTADPRARALYLAPTKALGHDQLRTAQALTTAIERLAHAGAVPTTALAVTTELFRDWTSEAAGAALKVIHWYFLEAPKLTEEIGVAEAEKQQAAADLGGAG